jgi:gliding motility-associated-like protein
VQVRNKSLHILYYFFPLLCRRGVDALTLKITRLKIILIGSLATLWGEVTLSQNSFTISVNTYAYDCQLASAAVHVQGGVPPYNIQWSYGAIGDTVSSLNAGNYSITIMDSNNPPKDTVVNFVINELVCKATFNNRFTPNGDGINDTWGIGNIRDYPNFLLQVFDRWGQLVHTQRGQYIPWDGTHLGLKIPDATYYYIFFYEEGKTKNYEKGSVTIVR